MSCEASRGTRTGVESPLAKCTCCVVVVVVVVHVINFVVVILMGWSAMVSYWVRSTRIGQYIPH